MSHKSAIENSPLQAYASALLFSPTSSLIKGLFKREEPNWITTMPTVDERWSPCLQTLEGHSDVVTSVAFSYDSARLASTSHDKTVRIWNASGECLQIFSVARVLSDISFDISDSYLHTEIGTIDISALPGSVKRPTVSEPRSPQYQGLGLSADGVWITLDSENLVWLPPEYRPHRSAVVRNTIGIGVRSGKVWMCKLLTN